VAREFVVEAEECRGARGVGAGWGQDARPQLKAAPTSYTNGYVSRRGSVARGFKRPAQDRAGWKTKREPEQV
jgi:hypothetical protein